MFCPSTGLCYTVNACVFPWKTFFRQLLPRKGPQGGVNERRTHVREGCER